MGQVHASDPTRIHRHRYIVEDPARFLCLAAAAVLLFLPQPGLLLTMAVIAAVQLGPVLMMARSMNRGWSSRWGRTAHPSVFSSSLAMDFTQLSAGTLVGALLLARHFTHGEGADIARPLGVLAVAVAFLPDLRLCRWLLAGDPAGRSRELREGLCLRDPVMLASLLAAAVVCFIDELSLTVVFLSLLLFQFNAVLVILDKYLPEIEVARHRGWKAVLLEREGRRLWLCLAPLALIPLRVSLGDRAGILGACLLAAVVAAPDLLRGLAWAGRAVGNMFRVTPAPRGGGTYIVLPRIP